jgi:hypothetical protein
MFNRFSRFRNRLVVKLIFMICCVIIPIILLMIGITNLMIHNLQDKLVDSYKNELAICMTRIDEQLSVIDMDIDNLIANNWAELNLADKSNIADIQKYQFWKELQNYRSNLDVVSVCYIKTNWDNKAMITYNNSTCSYFDAERIRYYLTKVNLIKSIKKITSLSRLAALST